MKRYGLILTVCLVAVMVAVSAGCGTGASESTAGGSASAAASTDPIVIGVVDNETGMWQPWGQPSTEMAQIAVAEFNAAGGVLSRQLKLDVVDQGDNYTTNGPAGVKKVISDGAVVVVTQGDYDVGAPAQVTAQNAGIPAISWSAGAPQFGPKGLGPLTYSMGAPTPDEAAVAAEWAFQKKGWKTAYILNDPSISYNTTWCKYFAKRWQQLGGAIVGNENFQQKDPNAGPLIDRVRSASPAPDVIILASYPPGGVTVLRQMRASGVKAPILMNIAMSGDYWVKSVPGLSDTYVTTNASRYLDDTPKVNELTTAYKTKYGKDVSISQAYMGYLTIQIIRDAIERAGSTDPKAIATALSATKGDFLLGPETIDPQYGASFDLPVGILAITDQKFSFLGRWKPEVDPRTLLP